MRRIDKEISKEIDANNIGTAERLAKAVGYSTRVYDGDAENGMCAPTLLYDKYSYDIGLDYYGRNE